jgi:WD40-like Beta Propeller Repeat
MGRGIVSFGTCVAVLCLAAPAEATFPGGNGKIVFENGGNLFTINPDGTGQTQLTSTGDARGPKWSPDGTKIAFYRLIGDNWDIWVMNADGSGFTQLTTDPASDIAPAWSPDGTSIAFETLRDDTNPFCPCNSEIYRMDADGSNQVRLTNSTATDRSPDWSPDGTRIAFHSYTDPTDRRIYTMKPDGTDQQQLIPEPAPTHQQTDPTWNPEGYRLAFSFTDVWTVNADGSAVVDVSNTSNYCESGAVWSPDAGKIAGSRIASGVNGCTATPHVFVMNADGSGLTGIATGESPDWQRVPLPPYVRPKGATPFQVYFDIAYQQCTAPNRTHGAPLAFASCTPPSPTSLNVTVGTPDSNGAAAKFRGSTLLQVRAGNPSTQTDEADVQVTVALTDIRCTDSTVACTGGALSDYTGSMRLVVPLRLTDAYVRGLPATSEGSISVPVPCTTTADTTVGSTCATTTTVDTLIPGAVREGNRAIWELGRLEVWDGGADGSLASRDDDTLFATQGLFIP